MRTLHISVNNKVATYIQRDGSIVCANSDYLLQFTFDSEWDGYTEKVARFVWNGACKDVKFTGTVCVVPVITKATEVHIGVYVDGENDIATTTSAVIPCQKSVRCETDTVQPEQVNEWREQAEEAAKSASDSVDIIRNLCEEIKELKQSGELNGADGKDGNTPLLRINAETYYWEVSYDDGETWISLNVKATGTEGNDYVLTDADKKEIAGLVEKDTSIAELDENNLIFKEDLVTTYAIGNYSLTNGSATIPAKGKSLKEVWNSIYLQEKQPSVTQPSFSFSASGGSGEVGSSFSLPTATFKVTGVGSYTYNDTGIKFSGSITGGENTKTFADLVTNGTVPVTTTGSITTYADSPITFSFSGKYSYNAGNTPVTNLGNTANVSAIAAVTDKAISISCTFTGYRKMFVGCLTSAKTSFSSDDIRGFTKISKQATRSEQSFVVPSGTKQIVIAYPMSLTSTSLTPTFKYEALGQWFTEENVTYIDTVYVAGANNAASVAYYVFGYTHSGTFASDTNYKIKV